MHIEHGASLDIEVRENSVIMQMEPLEGSGAEPLEERFDAPIQSVWVEQLDANNELVYRRYTPLALDSAVQLFIEIDGSTVRVHKRVVGAPEPGPFAEYRDVELVGIWSQVSDRLAVELDLPGGIA